MGAPRSFDDSLVFRRVLVGLEQNFVKLVANGLGTLAPAQARNPLVYLQLELFLLLNRRQCQRNDVGRGFAKAAFARAAKVVRRLKQPVQHAGLLFQRGLSRKIVTGEVGKAKLLVRRKLPGHLQFNGLAQGLRGTHELSGGGLFKPDQRVGGLDLDALAAVKLHLRRRICLGEDLAGQKLSGFFKQ